MSVIEELVTATLVHITTLEVICKYKIHSAAFSANMISRPYIPTKKKPMSYM